MLDVHGLACVRGERLLFRDLSFRVDAGSILWVSGGNGCGKTSLLRLLCGLARPEAGKVCWNGQDIRAEREEYLRDLVYLGHLNALKDDLSPEENLAFGLGYPVRDPTLRAALGVRGLCACLGLATRVLSQGQKRRVALARLALSSARKLWILDEPFAALDTAAVTELAGAIAAHARAGGMIVLTSHQDVPFADAPVSHLALDQRARRP